MDNIHNDGNTVLMSCVDKFLQLLRCSKTRTWCKERTDMITERAIIRMFLDSHDLDTVVSILNNARQHIVLEFGIGAHLFGILSHSYMALINEQRILLRLEVLLLELIFLFWIPHLGREYLRIVVLNYTTAPSWNTFSLTTVPVDLHLIELTVLQGFLGKFQFPVVRTSYTFTAVFLILLPIVKIANQIDVGRIRCPLTEHPSLCQFVESEIKMTRCEIRQFLLAIVGQLIQLPQGMIVTSANGVLKGFQP